jgi:hypothetical protein
VNKFSKSKLHAEEKKGKYVFVQKKHYMSLECIQTMPTENLLDAYPRK